MEEKRVYSALFLPFNLPTGGVDATEAILYLAEHENVTRFYSLCDGFFDTRAARCVYACKPEHPDLQNVFVRTALSPAMPPFFDCAETFAADAPEPLQKVTALHALREACDFTVSAACKSGSDGNGGEIAIYKGKNLLKKF